MVEGRDKLDTSQVIPLQAKEVKSTSFSLLVKTPLLKCNLEHLVRWEVERKIIYYVRSTGKYLVTSLCYRKSVYMRELNSKFTFFKNNREAEQTTPST